MIFFLALSWTLTQALQCLQIPDLGDTISSHSRVSNHEESPPTILLQHPQYQSRTVEISSEIIAINGTAHSRPTILESQQVKGTLLHVTNSTASFANLAFQSLTARILTAIDHSECLVANSVISVIEEVSPIECSDSLIRVVNSEFDFTSTQNRSPSLSTTTSLSSSVSFHSCSFSDVLVTSPGSLISCSCVQTSETDRCDFRNISHCSTFLQSSFSPPFHNVSVLNSRFWDCENVLFGGVVRDTEDRTSLLAANMTFTRSRSTYTNITGESFGPNANTTRQVVTVDHRYQQCTFTQCVAQNDYGGGILCESGANLAVDKCTFIECSSVNGRSANAQGGAVFFDGNGKRGGVSITRSLVSKCGAVYGGGIRVSKPKHLVIQFCNVSECDVSSKYGWSGMLPWGGGIGLSGMSVGSVLSNIRFERNTGGTGAHLDNNDASGSVTYSNLLFAYGKCRQGNVIFSDVAGNDVKIAFFSCTFFLNVATDTRKGPGQYADTELAIGNDIRLYNLPVWERILKDKSSFVNCFSTSEFPKIAVDNNPLGVDFSLFEAGNETRLDIHLPTPGIMVSAEAGEDEDGCGSTGTFDQCQSIGFTGEFRLADANTSVLVEGGRYEETISFNVGSKPAFFSSIGVEYPVVSFTPQSGEDRFMELGVGTLSLSYFTIVPCETASIVKVVGAGMLIIELCTFQNEDGLSPTVKASIITMSEGTGLLQKVTVLGISFDEGRIVRCSGDVTKLEIQECVFTGMSGTAGPLISFERLSEGGEFIVNESKLHGSAVSGSVGGILTNYVETVTITSSTFASLATSTQKAAIDLSSCTSLTLSSLLFELCLGTSASDISITNSPLISLSSPLDDSFSVSRSPTSSIDGVPSDPLLSRPSLLVAGTSGSDEAICWKNVGCASITFLLLRVDQTIGWEATLKAETTGDCAISISNNLQLTMTGTTQTGSILSHTGAVSSPLLSVASGSLSVSQLTFSTNNAGTTHTASFFSVTGGSISLTSVSFSPMSFSSSSSLITLTGASSITLSTIDFSGMATEGSGSVLHSISTGTIALSSVTFSSCNCGASQKGRSVFIERSFVTGCVSMTSVQVSSAGTVGSHDIFLKGSNIASTVTQAWDSLIGAENTLTYVVMDQVVGEEEGSVAKSGPLAYLWYPYTGGSMNVDGSFWDHESCGKEKLPCKSFGNVHSKLNTSNQKVVFLSAYTLSGEVNSLALGSVLTTKLSPTVPWLDNPSKLENPST
ncbi:hypothetical protein BLNAU_16214 [Blattamonas nauphoetae]|uniref:Uncharacterized protein n=1 Tax=Blattamonas nauphoetae TaxID=2049346 RepID=A0ABQ9XAB8_9EUKA|nr:hypothetical protein BLNAU_16214 [Blattamonas nauphoetae]